MTRQRPAAIPRRRTFRKKVNRLNNMRGKLESGNLGAARQTKMTNRFNNLQGKLAPKLNNRITKIGGKLSAGQGNADRLTNRQTKFQNALNPLKSTGVTVDQGVTTQPAGDPEVIPGVNESDLGAANPIEDYMAALFPQATGLNFQDRDITQSPYYKYQQERGEEALNRYNAARGLTDSRAEERAFMDFNQGLLGQETEANRGIDQREADRAQLNGNRLWNVLSSEADRSERGADRQFNQMMQVYNTMLGQSPMEYAYGATGDSANIMSNYGTQGSNLMSQNYSTPMPSFGGGGGGGGGYQAPFPQQPDMSGIALMQAIMNGSNNSSVGSGIGDFLGGLAGELF